eukprot:GHVO01039970.1.p1 GENE.GHVO01039970.1~~GHVO01039970.1.p1  ORF type:complete len:162 (+),score=17.49 GHVO01039970.1:596-1081(+)
MSEKGDFEQQRPVLLNPVLSYAYVRMKKAPRKQIRDSLLNTFEDSEFADAKDALWQYETEKVKCLLGEKTKRRGSTTRTSTEADCKDVLQALFILDQAGELPPLAVTVQELMVLPPIMPQLINAKRRVEDDEEQVRLTTHGGRDGAVVARSSCLHAEGSRL